MHGNQHHAKVALPPEIAEWMGASDRTSEGSAPAGVEVPSQRGWRDRLKTLLGG